MTAPGREAPQIDMAAHSEASSYSRLETKLAQDRCVVLDGGVATELQRVATGLEPDAALWGTWALYSAPRAVLDVHRAYAATGCDVVSTNTWSILSAPEMEKRPGLGRAELAHWMDIARLGVRLARQGIEEAGRTGECAVAFAISEEVNSPDRVETIELLTRVLEDEPPDLLLLETMTLIREPSTFETIELLLETGLPVWLSFRRCRHGVCGVYGQHWGPPEGDRFGRAARRFEQMGVRGLLVNCLPVDHVPGMISWLRDFTELPLGVYPNLGYLAGSRWRFDPDVGPDEYAALALSWREEGAQIVGGCCGVTREHIATVVAALEGTKRGSKRREAAVALAEETATGRAEAWRDERGVDLYPVPFPDLVVEEGVFVPTAGSYLVWKELQRSKAGAGKTCLDVGCGCGILAVQLALNGADRVHAIDIDRNAVANTLSNAFRNGVAERVTGETIDLYHWHPSERFDLVVASLYQMPVDPYAEPTTGHRPLDYWGRNLLDHLIRLLPSLLAYGGVAYVMQLSIVSQTETARLLSDNGLSARVVDFSFFPFGPLFLENREQIARVEQLSDAYHLRLGGDDVAVAYLLEVARGPESVGGQPKGRR
jgi:S-methylmethionine-dependent homocysteine/selenocysteine methylase/SAM-dependent methyltransferase